MIDTHNYYEIMRVCVCTNQQNGLEYIEQNWRNCFTCDPGENLGVCIPCAEKCHIGHNLGEVRFGSFFCDCGAGTLENSYSSEFYTLNDKDIIIRALNTEITEKPVTCQIPLLDIERRNS